MELKFKNYLLIKEYLIRQSINEGLLNRKNEMSKFQLEEYKFFKIFDFLKDREIILEK